MWLQAHDSLEAAPPAQMRSLRHVRVETSSEGEQTHPSDTLPDTDTRSKLMLLPDMGHNSDRKERAAARKRARKRAAGSNKRDYRSQAGLTSILDYFLLRTPSLIVDCE